ncbi:hypothetical protein GGTG_07136 [Gaeumannomyces tritici R3-111a-1]|uniref:Uncharacterized protein n=1 Tax=Gaeumannomyces tritici (strain R3-111a-1) TaxID=644352 RepID=J3P0U1_GAET3|nr:hypothetical protein GGTG_07136 [Gaeumannomyces tritici R3-111a-1]EJT77224.1 hypothetical protein GGTG_07136 [Gaeumannomyces tritici R3-111a-1]
MHSINEVHVQNPNFLRCKSRVPAKLKTSPLPVLPFCKLFSLALYVFSGLIRAISGICKRYYHSVIVWIKEAGKLLNNFWSKHLNRTQITL